MFQTRTKSSFTALRITFPNIRVTNILYCLVNEIWAPNNFQDDGDLELSVDPNNIQEFATWQLSSEDVFDTTKNPS